MSHLLLADDDIELTGMLSEYLQGEDFSLDIANDGASALALALGQDYDLIILDVMMPKKNGFDVVRELRVHSRTPVLMLTARGEDVDSIVGLELGADDYLAKPCNPRVLVARIRALLRRADNTPPGNKRENQETLLLADIEIRPSERLVLRDKHILAMTSTEYIVLEILAREAGCVVSKTDLSERALSRKLTRYDRSLDMHISSLRKKLGPLSDGSERIKTVRGIGYQYVVQS